MIVLPSVVTRLDRARRLAGLTHEQLSAKLGLARAGARRYCLPPENPQSSKSIDRELREALVRWSGGKIHGGNYDELVDLETGETIEAAA
jgi:hypothetical protein